MKAVGRKARESRVENLSGRLFGRLVVVEFYKRLKGVTYWRCLCSCGQRTTVSARHLKSGHTQSCGCLKLGKITDPAIGKRLATARTTAKAAREAKKPKRCARLKHNLVGQRFGKLVVLRLSKRVGSYHRRYWTARCNCKKKKDVLQQNLLNGRVTSCGCVHRTYGLTHGQSRSNSGRGTPTFQSWRSMKDRCLNCNNKSYGRYGGAGITICDRWLGENGFENFFIDVGERPAGTSIDRINPLLGYEPDNVRWATPSQQAKNRRANWLKEHPEQAKVLLELKLKRREEKKAADRASWERGIAPYPERWPRMSATQRYIWLMVWRGAEERAAHTLRKALEKKFKELDRITSAQAAYQRAKAERTVGLHTAEREALKLAA